MILPLLAGLCGAILMALEILASRIVAPYFGNSVYVWGSIISVFLATMSVGYFLGGRRADRRPSVEALGRVIALAAFWLLGLRFWSAELVVSIADWTAASPAGNLLICALLFGVPGVLFGMVSPYVVRLAADDLAAVGRTSGHVYAVSTIGSLIGTLGCTFVAIPRFGVTEILSTLTAATAATGALALARGRRTELAACALVAVLPFVAGDRPGAADGDVVAVRSTPYQTLEVIDRAGVRYLRSDRITQSAIWLDSGEAASRYVHWAAASLLLDAAPRRALVIGMGAGLVADVLRRAVPQLDVDFVELDPAVPELVEQVGMWTPHPRDRVHIADGRRFVQRSDRRWDFIYVDAYVGLAVPFHLTTREFFAVAAERLDAGGSIGVNLAAGLDDPFSRSILHTLRQSFRTTLVFDVPGAGNVLLLASERPPPSAADLARSAAALEGSSDLPVPLPALAASRIDWGYDAAGLVELRDDYAPAEHLVLLGERDFDLALLSGRELVDR